MAFLIDDHGFVILVGGSCDEIAERVSWEWEIYRNDSHVTPRKRIFNEHGIT